MFLSTPLCGRLFNVAHFYRNRNIKLCILPPVDNHPLSTEPLASPPGFRGRASVIAWECCWLSTESGEKRVKTSRNVRGGGVICALQMYRVFRHWPMGLLYRGSPAPITGVFCSAFSYSHTEKFPCG